VNSKEIRDSFLNFFAEKNHKIIPSSSLIPHGDPTLLLTTAGMVQIKPYFLGLTVPPNPRLASCQKCFRTTDVDSVGDNKHLTFFEMLGNFSVGDYFKKESISWAWEFVTDRLHLPREKLWVTIFLDDDEAFDIWRGICFPKSKIVRLGEKDNFWGPAGDSGPCGPCSEIHYDFGEKYGCGKPECDPSCSCGRFSEIWNLVFTEYNQDRNGNRTRLPKPNIDTGMGLERIVAAYQGNPSVYDTDLFMPIIQIIGKITGKATGKGEIIDGSVKIIAEHSRGITFLIADGVLPSNEGRGYVLRRILRRACFLGRRLGIERPFIGDIAEVVINKMGKVYPELVTNKKLIFDIIKNEEGKFNDTLDAGINLCEKAIEEAKSENRDCLLSEEVFKFWDTYGFPFELSAEIARDHGLSIDRDGFKAEMEKQRERARATHKFTTSKGEENVLAQAGSLLKPTAFVGYEELTTKSEIIQIVDSETAKPLTKAGKGQNVTLVLDRTPFYGEMGGQVGDTGKIKSKSGEANIANAISYSTNGIMLSGRVLSGTIAVGDTIDAEVDERRRLDIARNHTATHVLQAVMRKVLGSQVSQRGSRVAPDRLRFDFTHLSSISKEQLKEIQAGVNEIIRKNLPVLIETCPYDKAISEGATAIFEEKYGDVVRVVRIGEPRVSAELCGGTHIRSTGEIGYFVIANEASIGTGLRRIEAVTGRGAEAFVNDRFALFEEAASELKVLPSEMPAKVRSLLENINSANKNITALQKELSKHEIERIITENLIEINGVKTVYAQVSPVPMSSLMHMGDMLRERLKSAVIVLATVYEDKPYFIATATPDLVAKGLHSGKLIKKVSEIAGGSGGGKAEMAQAGAKLKEKMGEALQAVPEFVEELLKAGHA
jgi:alanyl-tRNA synthetase